MYAGNYMFPKLTEAVAWENELRNSNRVISPIGKAIGKISLLIILYHQLVLLCINSISPDSPPEAITSPFHAVQSSLASPEALALG